jgi:hypothetical protein
MGTGYTRNDVTNNISDGNVINASDLDGEFDAIEAAFDSATGHTHDGTTAEGAPITMVGPAQEWLVDGTALFPKTDDAFDIGKSGAEVRNLWVDGTANIDALVADTADINGGTFDGVVGGTTPAAGTFATLVATTADINAGTFDGVVGGTIPAAGTFTTLQANTTLTVANTAPAIILNDTNGSSGNSQVGFSVSGSSYGFVTRDNTGTPLAYFDYLAGRTTSGVTVHTFNVLGANIFDIDSSGVDVVGTLEVTGTGNFGAGIEVGGIISTPDGVEVRNGGAYFDARATGATDELGFRVLDTSSIQRASFIWNQTNADAMIQTYSSLGALRHNYNISDANFNIVTASALNTGFNLSLDGVRRVTIDSTAMKLYDTDGTTLRTNLPLDDTDIVGLGSTLAYSLTNASAANVFVTVDGTLRRSTSSGEFKINRELLGDTGGIVDSLDPVSFESTHVGDEGNRYTGFIAEEVAAVYPEAAADDGQNYDVRALVAILWKEVQDLRQRVAQLEAN